MQSRLVQEAPSGAVVRIEEENERPFSGARGFELRKSAEAPVGVTIDLHGRRVEEALLMMEEYLDNALLNDWPFVRFMPGAGTGAPGRAIREHHHSRPSIARFCATGPDEGGSGVIVVEFKG